MQHFLLQKGEHKSIGAVLLSNSPEDITLFTCNQNRVKFFKH